MTDDKPTKSKKPGLTGAREKLKAVLDVLRGRIRISAVAMLMKVSRTAVWEWKRKFISGGLEALRQKPRGSGTYLKSGEEI